MGSAQDGARQGQAGTAEERAAARGLRARSGRGSRPARRPGLRRVRRRGVPAGPHPHGSCAGARCGPVRRTAPGAGRLARSAPRRRRQGRRRSGGARCSRPARRPMASTARRAVGVVALVPAPARARRGTIGRRRARCRRGVARCRRRRARCRRRRARCRRRRARCRRGVARRAPAPGSRRADAPRRCRGSLAGGGVAPARRENGRAAPGGVAGGAGAGRPRLPRARRRAGRARAHDPHARPRRRPPVPVGGRARARAGGIRRAVAVVVARAVSPPRPAHPLSGGPRFARRRQPPGIQRSRGVRLGGRAR